MVIKNIRLILKEITLAADILEDSNINNFIKLILRSRHIVCCGAGRMGYVSKAFSMRLSHLGLNSYYYQDSNLPNLNEKDLIIIASGSGETKTMVCYSKIAKQNNIKIALITSRNKSTIAKLSSIIIKIPTPCKNQKNPPIKSIQPMTSLTEQFLFIFYDAIILEIINHLKFKNKNFWLNHSNLE